MILAGVLLAAPSAIGFTAGTPFTQMIRDTEAGYRFGFGVVDSTPRRLLPGVSGEWLVRGAWSVEAGAHYQRFGLDTRTGNSFLFPKVSTRSSTTGNAWSLPALARVHMALLPRVQLVLGAGLVVRVLSQVQERGARTEVGFLDPTPIVTQFTSSRPDRSPAFGAAADVALEWDAGPLRLSPRFRLTRWDSERSTAEPSSVRFGRNQAEVLFTAWLRTRARQPAARKWPDTIEPGLLTGPAPGAIVDVRFLPRWSAEGSFLTRRFESPQPFATYAGREWNPALLLKGRPWQRGRYAASLGAGPVWRRASNAQFRFPSFTSSAWVPGGMGVTAAAGGEFRAARLRWRPEVRWIWFNEPIEQYLVSRRPRGRVHFTLGITPAWR